MRFGEITISPKTGERNESQQHNFRARLVIPLLLSPANEMKKTRSSREKYIFHKQSGNMNGKAQLMSIYTAQ